MFKGKTTIVVGAGAGVDYNMPVGTDLVKRISEMLRFKKDVWDDVHPEHHDLFRAVNQFAKVDPEGGLQPYLDACDDIIAGMHEAQSIDEFVHTRRGDRRIELCAKAAIVCSILEYERNSKLWFEPKNINSTIDFGAIQKTWMPELRKFITGDAHIDEVEDRLKQVTLIIFNYDRCVEHYFLHSLMLYHKLDEGSAAKILESLTIIHPYGVVGSLPWQSRPDPVEFAAESNIDIPLLCGEIRTFTEQSEDNEANAAIKKAMKESSLILFLGFAYHTQNIDLLAPATSDRRVRAMGTAISFSDNDTTELARIVARKFCGSSKTSVSLSNKYDCRQLLTENRMPLSI